MDSPKINDLNENDNFYDMHTELFTFRDEQQQHHGEDYVSEGTDSSVDDRNGDERKDRRNNRRERQVGKPNRDKQQRERRGGDNRDQQLSHRTSEPQLKDSLPICLFYLQGKCQKVSESVIAPTATWLRDCFLC